MRKAIVFLSQVVLVLVMCQPLLAQEQLTISTYYPSPYGSYDQLEVSRSVTYQPIDKSTITDPRRGELIYDSSDDQFYYYNASAWVSLGGGGTPASWNCAVVNGTSQVTSSAVCPVNRKLITGGCTGGTSTSHTVPTSRPQPGTGTGGWFCASNTAYSLTAYAWCCGD